MPRACLLGHDGSAGKRFNTEKHLFERQIEPQSTQSVLRVETDRSLITGHEQLGLGGRAPGLQVRVNASWSECKPERIQGGR